MGSRTTTRILTGAGVALLALTLAGCGGDDSTARDTDVDVSDRSFVSTSVTGHDLVAGSQIRVSFDGPTMAVNGGCNTLTTTYKHAGGVVSWTGEPAQTMMACEPDLMEQDTWLSTLFRGGLEAYASGDADLVLESGDVRIELSKEK